MLVGFVDAEVRVLEDLGEELAVLWEIEPGRAPFVRLRIGTVAGS